MLWVKCIFFYFSRQSPVWQHAMTKNIKSLQHSQLSPMREPSPIQMSSALLLKSYQGLPAKEQKGTRAHSLLWYINVLLDFFAYQGNYWEIIPKLVPIVGRFSWLWEKLHCCMQNSPGNTKTYQLEIENFFRRRVINCRLFKIEVNLTTPNYSPCSNWSIHMLGRT